MLSVTEQELEAASASARARDIRASRRQEDVVVSHTERMLDESTFDFSEPQATLKDKTQVIEASCYDCDYFCAEVRDRERLSGITASQENNQG